MSDHGESCGGLCSCGLGADPASQPTPQPDQLEVIFRKQAELMDQLIMADKLPEAPIDITSKHGQRQIKELIFATIEELAEASFILKNRSHRFTDHTDVDFAHFKEELADALAYFVEICIFSGIGPAELFTEYCAKNAIVKNRVKNGY
jgi:NTP pyrophosphatase (non-canonical NTP hydrolase)